MGIVIYKHILERDLIYVIQKEALTEHANDRPQKCSVCDKCFIPQSALNFHLGFTLVRNHTQVQHVGNLSQRGYFM